MKIRTQLAAKQWDKIYFENGAKHRITVRAELVHLSGNSNAYFSITGEIKMQARNNRWTDQGCGAIHDDILKHFPHLQILVDLHLSDENGVPMHAFDNAGYWAGTYMTHDTNIVVLAKHLRVSEESATEIVTYLAHNFGSDFDKVTTVPMAWESVCKDWGLPEQWADEAIMARALLNEVQVSA